MASEKEKEAMGDYEEKEPLKNGELADGAVVVGDGANDLDTSRARFIKDKDAEATADAHVDIEGRTSLDSAFVGLTKEELAQYANDPYWKKVRLALLILFWISWVGMLVAAVVIIVLAPKCPPRPDLDWWQTSVVYNAYPRSFKESEDKDASNGVGDLNGIHSKLGYLSDKLNASALYLNPIYPSPNMDFGYDVSDYKSINPEFGTMEDFDNLRIAMHKKGMKLILDFVPNHSSDNHTWFLESVKGVQPYKNFYIWHPGQGASKAPNNWRSKYGGSAWTWSDERQAWYYHQYSASQPDLNLYNPAVLDELDDILKFWLDKGVDGFRVDSAALLCELQNVTDKNEPANGGSAENDYNNYEHIYTTFQPQSYVVVTRWREILDVYTAESSKSRFLMVESYGTPNQTAMFARYDEKDGAHLITNMNLLTLDSDCRAKCILATIDNWFETVAMFGDVDLELWSNWQLSNQEHSRVATRTGEDWINALNMMLLTLPGTSFVYYGDEIGMHDVQISFDDTKDPIARMHQDDYMMYSRDPQRTPMQWNYDNQTAGFCKEGTKPWLPIALDSVVRNVKTQEAHGAGITNIEVFEKISLLRQQPSFQWGDIKTGTILDILWYVRQAEGFPGFLVAINFGPSTGTVNFVDGAPKNLVPREAEVVGTTDNFDGSRAADFEIGKTASLDNVLLKPMEGVVFKWTADQIPKEEL